MGSRFVGVVEQGPCFWMCLGTGALELNGLMHIADVETACPRLSFARWSMVGGNAW